MASAALKAEMQKTSGAMNMTPMIDVVFQLIIFFMLLMDFSQQTLELLTLPMADSSRPDKDPSKERLILNVAWQKDEFKKPAAERDGSKYEYRILGNLIRNDQLLDRLKKHGAKSLDEKALSKMSVLIRCDVNMEYRSVLFALVECMKAKIWKIELAIKESKNPKHPN